MTEAAFASWMSWAPWRMSSFMRRSSPLLSNSCCSRSELGVRQHNLGDRLVGAVLCQDENTPSRQLERERREETKRAQGSSERRGSTVLRRARIPAFGGQRGSPPAPGRSALLAEYSPSVFAWALLTVSGGFVIIALRWPQ